MYQTHSPFGRLWYKHTHERFEWYRGNKLKLVNIAYFSFEARIMWYKMPMKKKAILTVYSRSKRLYCCFYENDNKKYVKKKKHKKQATTLRTQPSPKQSEDSDIQIDKKSGMKNNETNRLNTQHTHTMYNFKPNNNKPFSMTRNKNNRNKRARRGEQTTSK